MTNIKVKHVASRDDWKEPKDGSGTWIEYWEKHSGYQLQDFCRDCRKKVTSDNPFVGAHVKKINSSDNSIYIVPTCDRCNKQGKSGEREFIVAEEILVPANKGKL